MGQRRIRVAEDPGHLVRLGRQDHPVGREGRPPGRGDPPGAPVRPHLGHALAQAHRPRRQPAGQGPDQLLHPAGEGHEERPARPARAARLPGRAPPGPPERQDDAPLPPLDLEEPRHGRRQGQRVRVRRVDAGDEGLGHPLERFPAEPPTDEGAQALVGVAPARQDEVEAHAELARPGEEARGEERPESRRGQELKAIGQRMQPPAKGDEGAPEAVVRADEAVLHAQAPAELERPRLLGQEGVRAPLHQEAVLALGADGAAQASRRLEDRQLQGHPSLAGDLEGVVGRREPGHPSADDDEPHGPPGRAGAAARAAATRSASMAMKAGWSFTAGARW